MYLPIFYFYFTFNFISLGALAFILTLLNY